ncbi:unnamed protein product [Cylicocyclus nassatus]|uniref:Apple domain-containing protein n=1 Tax=Cylicocyclus nassatus TaxID=53992 RepID=A0AA36H575_CYLNA|nr:unnamed protein product [Cylicocyclus nassatus]
MATFDETTEEECMSKCSMVLECTFMEYNEGFCKTYKYGTEVHDLDSASKAFAYSFDEEQTSCPTATVSRPQSYTKKPTVKLSIDDICDRRYNYSEWEAVTKTSWAETPDDIRTCLYNYTSFVSRL